MLDFFEARNQICELALTNWTANAPGIVGTYTPELYMPRIPRRSPPDQAKHWAQLSINTVMSNQAAFVGYTREDRKAKKYEESGLVFIQLFGPRSAVDGAEIQDRLAQMARAGFRGKSTAGKVWFRNARINDIPPENEMLRLNVVAEYEYYEIG